MVVVCGVVWCVMGCVVCGVVWGVVWCVWCGVVWCGVWCGTGHEELKMHRLEDLTSGFGGRQ